MTGDLLAEEEVRDCSQGLRDARVCRGSGADRTRRVLAETSSGSTVLPTGAFRTEPQELRDNARGGCALWSLHYKAPLRRPEVEGSREGQSAVCWLTPPMLPTARVDSSQSQEPHPVSYADDKLQPCDQGTYQQEAGVEQQGLKPSTMDAGIPCSSSTRHVTLPTSGPQLFKG